MQNNIKFSKVRNLEELKVVKQTARNLENYKMKTDSRYFILIAANKLVRVYYSILITSLIRQK